MTNKEIEQKASKADFKRSKFIPTFNNRPITLIGIPYLTSGTDIFSDAFGLFLPIKYPTIKKGIMLINKLKIALKNNFINNNIN